MTEEPKPSAEAIEMAYERLAAPLRLCGSNHPAVIELAKMIEKYETPPTPEVDPLVEEAEAFCDQLGWHSDVLPSVILILRRGIELGREQRKLPELTWEEAGRVISGDTTLWVRTARLNAILREKWEAQ